MGITAVPLSSGLSFSGLSLQGALGLRVPHELVLRGSLQLGVLERRVQQPQVLHGALGLLGSLQWAFLELGAHWSLILPGEGDHRLTGFWRCCV